MERDCMKSVKPTVFTLWLFNKKMLTDHCFRRYLKSSVLGFYHDVRVTCFTGFMINQFFLDLCL